MKIKIIAFILLFLCSIPCYKVCARPTNEKSVDSSLFYYKLLLNPKNPIHYRKAIKFYKNRYKTHIEKDRLSEAAYDLEVIATGNYNIGDFSACEKNLVKALKLSESSTSAFSIDAQMRIYNRLGILYRNLEAYDESLNLYSRSLGKAKKHSDSIRIILNVSNVLRDDKKFSKSIDTLKFILNLVDDKNDASLKAYILDDLGYNEVLSKNDSSLVHISKSLEIRKKNNDTVGLFSNYRHLALYYKSIENMNQAVLYSKKALTLSKKIMDPTYELEALGIVASLSKNIDMQRFKFLSDSLKSESKARENRYAAMKYDVEKEKGLTHKAQIQKGKEKRKKDVYFFLSLFLILISFTIIYVILQQRKQRRLQAIRHTEASISKKIHDGLANDTFQVLSELQNLREIPEHILSKLDKIYLETRDIARIHSPLIEDANFEDQLISRLNSYRSDQLNVITRDVEKIEWDSFNKIKKDTIYIVLGELLTNNKKHSKASLALISFEQNGKKLGIKYQDNGIGTHIKKGNGLKNMESRIDAIKGNISFESELNKGFKVQMQI